MTDLERAILFRQQVALTFDDRESVYGFPATGDPRNFLPSEPGDGDCEPDELIRWWQDYQRAEAGEDVKWPGCFQVGTVHVARTRWGLGITRLRGAE